MQAAVGAVFDGDGPPGWRRELLNTVSTNVRYVHTKFMLIDPLGHDPVVVTGSANFSDASTTENDENMLVIRGDARVADIYLGEFMRLWRHHHFRGIVRKPDPATGVERPNYLAADDRWAYPFFLEGAVKFKRRQAFAGRALTASAGRVAEPSGAWPCAPAHQAPWATAAATGSGRTRSAQLTPAISNTTPASVAAGGQPPRSISA